MNHQVRHFQAFFITALVLPCPLLSSASEMAWEGEASWRIWVEVPPSPINDRAEDLRPARATIDFAEIVVVCGEAGKVLPDSIVVVQCDMQSRNPLSHTGSLVNNTPPHRFDNAHLRERSYMYNLISDAQKGDLVWVHRQIGSRPSLYALYFDIMPEDAPLPATLPRPMLGDIDAMYARQGYLSSLYHTRPAAADWNGDGRNDLFVGNILGHIFLHENSGTPQVPLIETGRMVQAAGEPIDVGFYAAPCAADWDNDGDLDLVCGVDGGQVLWFEHVESELIAAKPVISDGAPIITPPQPCPETPFFTKDYVPVPEAVDWDGDGDMDLLVGGYVTGLVFYFENMNNAAGAPTLEARGPLEADKAPIDVLWQAAPCAADFDGDGDLDLLCGTMDHRVHESRKTSWPSFFYFENVGTRSDPKLVRRAFPLDENIDNLTNPRATDWDADGDLDIVVGVNHVVRLLLNVGSPTRPQFKAQPPMTLPWMPRVMAGFAAPPVDWDNDGDTDFILSGSRTARFLENVEDGNPPEFEERGLVSAAGEVVSHEFLLGDDHTFAEAFDWDADGDLDYLLGNSAGEVWWYENVGTPEVWDLAKGRQFMLESGIPLHVGQPLDVPMTDFATHSGNRSDPAPGDFDGDGDHDVVVSDAYGKVTYFENVRTNNEPLFAAGIELFAGQGRCVMAAVDWDGDGLLDLLPSWTGDGLWFCRNIGTATEPHFEKTRRYDLPWIPYPHPYPIDWNRDGDLDLILASSYSFCYFAERSFLENGYAEAEIISDPERRPR